MTHTPTSAQAAKLAALAVVRSSAESTLTTNLAALAVAQTNYRNAPSTATAAALSTAQTNLATAKAAYRSAAGDHVEYASYVYIGTQRSNILDSGGPDGI
jgi:hypothetical protein